MRRARGPREARASESLQPTAPGVGAPAQGESWGPASSEDAVSFIAMEYVAGQTLGQLIGRKGLKLGEALKGAVQIVK